MRITGLRFDIQGLFSSDNKATFPLIADRRTTGLNLNPTNAIPGHRSPIDELHLLWDLACGRYATWDTETDHKALRVKINTEAQRIREKYAEIGQPEVERIQGLPHYDYRNPVIQEFLKYRDESHTMAADITYKGIVEGEYVSELYLEKGKEET